MAKITKITKSMKDALVRCEATLERVRDVMIEGLEALQTIRDGHLYTIGGHATFADYCFKRWGISRATAYRLSAPEQRPAKATRKAPAEPEDGGLVVAAHEAEPPPEPATPVVGEVVETQKAARDIIAAGDVDFNAMISALDAAIGIYREMEVRDWGQGLDPGLGRDLERCRDAVKLGRPTWCPQCGGAGCHPCSGTGWLYTHQASQVKQDMKRKRR